MKNIEVDEVKTQAKAVEVHIPEASISGWFGFCRQGPEVGWMVLYPFYGGTLPDLHRCPSPLFPSKGAALEAAAKVMPAGGQVKLVYLEL